jgi:hypothetical protein
MFSSVDNFEELWVLVGALHMLDRRASGGVAVRAPVVAPESFEPFGSGSFEF